ncbi:MAG TPA: EamA family transporter, partial [Gemmataceae bacterium]|nr:EamA family transporter [Gemmataceae bacterium]
MNSLAHASAGPSPARWKIIVAFALVYVSWGTTYLAIGKGVEVFPPALFGGLRLMTAGLILLAYLALCRRSLHVSWMQFRWTVLIGSLMFVGGNGLLTVGEMYVPSGVASVIVATTPLFIACLEMCWPHGERLTLAGWAGVLAGLVGVSLLLVPGLHNTDQLFRGGAPLLLLGSSFSWAVGSFIVRHRKLQIDHLLAAAYQMTIGGGVMVLIGLSIGEYRSIQVSSFNVQGVGAFFYLLVVGSLIGFVAFNWLLGHVSATAVGTYAYVNPVVAI